MHLGRALCKKGLMNAQSEQANQGDNFVFLCNLNSLKQQSQAKGPQTRGSRSHEGSSSQVCGLQT